MVSVLKKLVEIKKDYMTETICVLESLKYLLSCLFFLLKKKRGGWQAEEREVGVGQKIQSGL